MEPFKNIYNEQFFDAFTDVVKTVISGFNKTKFTYEIYDKDWEDRELKARMRHITNVLRKHLSPDYSNSVQEILKIIVALKQSSISEKSLEFMFFPDFIEVYGLDDYNTSVAALKTITPFTSCEFAVRPFIIKYQNIMVRELIEWSKDDNYHVRRLASEGSRSRLPWAMAIPAFKNDPSPVLPILEQLKNDESEYVRRSVANNLNDISKDHPDLVVSIAKKWIGKTPETDKLVKHASRTLLKQGHPELMVLFGFGQVDKLKIQNFKIVTPVVKIGSDFWFKFDLKNESKSDLKIRLEYGLYYQKANSTLSKKVYKISEKIYSKKSLTSVERKQSFKLITTRKFHIGLHQVSLIINGVEFDKYDFDLVN